MSLQDKVVAQLEQDMMADMYSKMSDSCYKRCINISYKEDHLNKGETVCIDRCVAKYLETHQTLGNALGETTKQNQAKINDLQDQLLK